MRGLRISQYKWEHSGKLFWNNKIANKIFQLGEDSSAVSYNYDNFRNQFLTLHPIWSFVNGPIK